MQSIGKLPQISGLRRIVKDFMPTSKNRALNVWRTHSIEKSSMHYFPLSAVRHCSRSTLAAPPPLVLHLFRWPGASSPAPPTAQLHNSVSLANDHRYLLRIPR